MFHRSAARPTPYRYLLVSLLVVSSSGSATAEVTNDVVHYQGNGIVVSTFGGCVRTKWDRPDDPCVPPKPAVEVPKPVAHVSKARQLNTEQRTVYFEFNRSVIVESEHQKLDSLASVLKQDEDVRGVRIVGYADRLGSVDYNDKLSQKRAEAVEQYLRSRGYLHTSRTQTRWLGKTSPVAQCSDKLSRKELIPCLQQDRRVEVEIDYTSDQPKAK